MAWCGPPTVSALSDNCHSLGHPGSTHIYSGSHACQQVLWPDTAQLAPRPSPHKCCGVQQACLAWPTANPSYYVPQQEMQLSLVLAFVWGSNAAAWPPLQPPIQFQLPQVSGEFQDPTWLSQSPPPAFCANQQVPLPQRWTHKFPTESASRSGSLTFW